MAWLKGIPCFVKPDHDYENMLPPGYRLNVQRTLLQGHLPLDPRGEPTWKPGLVLVEVEDYGDVFTRSSLTILSIDRY